MKISVTILSAEITKDTHRFSAMKPYVVVNVHGVEKKTSVVKEKMKERGKHPQWSETLTFTAQLSDSVNMKLYDKHLVKDTYIGAVEVPMSMVIEAGNILQNSFTFCSKDNGGLLTARIEIVDRRANSVNTSRQPSYSMLPQYSPAPMMNQSNYVSPAPLVQYGQTNYNPAPIPVPMRYSTVSVQQPVITTQESRVYTIPSSQQPQTSSWTTAGATTVQSARNMSVQSRTPVVRGNSFVIGSGPYPQNPGFVITPEVPVAAQAIPIVSYTTTFHGAPRNSYSG